MLLNEGVTGEQVKKNPVISSKVTRLFNAGLNRYF